MSSLHAFTRIAPATPAANWPPLPDVLGPARTRRVFHIASSTVCSGGSRRPSAACCCRPWTATLPGHACWTPTGAASTCSIGATWIADLDPAAGHFGPMLCK
ncbi:hypothetical protein [Zoogloea sp.]|uniref:hypothetical protein n=1 Tax=Zoogloea sp. TaxID=49181 RepID=UPI001ACD0173|nr:hypothetical protein [Zoogloea sp.]MBN8282944.1 hypothetical protein [Zoogloea sp.]